MSEPAWITHIKEHQDPRELYALYSDMSPFAIGVTRECRDELYNCCRVRVKDAYRDQMEFMYNHIDHILKILGVA